MHTTINLSNQSISTICNTIEKGWEEVKSSMKEGRSLKSADDLLTELKTLK